MRILVVDDSPANRLVLREMLSAQKAEVTECDGGSRALEEIRAQAGRQFDPELIPLFEAEINLAPLDEPDSERTDDAVVATAAGLAMATRHALGYSAPPRRCASCRLGTRIGQAFGARPTGFEHARTHQGMRLIPIEGSAEWDAGRLRSA